MRAKTSQQELLVQHREEQKQLKNEIEELLSQASKDIDSVSSKDAEDSRRDLLSKKNRGKNKVAPAEEKKTEEKKPAEKPAKGKKGEE
jgi:hypothetical protein